MPLNFPCFCTCCFEPEVLFSSRLFSDKCPKNCIFALQNKANIIIRILSRPIRRSELEAMLPGYFGDMIKAVVDVQKSIVGLYAELHADIERELLQQGSDLWGINLYPEMEGEDFMEFDSLINIRPHQGSRSRDVQDPAIRKRIVEVINTFGAYFLFFKSFLMNQLAFLTSKTTLF